MEINYQKMLETIMDALNYATLVDENCRIIYMSRNYYEGVYGLSRDDIIGRHICDIVPDSRIPAILKNGRASLGEYYYSRTLGRIRLPIGFRCMWMGN